MDQPGCSQPTAARHPRDESGQRRLRSSRNQMQAGMRFTLGRHKPAVSRENLLEHRNLEQAPKEVALRFGQHRRTRLREDDHRIPQPQTRPDREQIFE